MEHLSKAVRKCSRVSIYEYIRAGDCQALLPDSSLWSRKALREEKEKLALLLTSYQAVANTLNCFPLSRGLARTPFSSPPSLPPSVCMPNSLRVKQVAGTRPRTLPYIINQTLREDIDAIHI